MTRSIRRLYRVATVGRILDIGERSIFKRMRDLGCIGSDNRPARWAEEQGLLVQEERQFRWPHRNGENSYYVTLVTQQGLDWLREQLKGQAA